MADTTTRIYELQVKLAQESLKNLKEVKESSEAGAKALEYLVDKGKELAGTFLVGITLDSFIDNVKEAGKWVADLADQAEKLGVETRGFSQLAYAADQSNASVEDLAAGVKNLQKNMVDLQSKGGKVLDALGIDKTKDAITVLEQFADKFKEIDDPVLKTNALLETFGKQGLQLRALMEQGAAGIETLRQRSDALGATIQDDTKERLEALDNAMKDVTTSTRGVFVQIADGLAPALVDISKGFVESSDNALDFKTIGEDLGDVLKGVALIANGVATTIKGIGLAIGALAAAAAAAAQGDMAGAKAIINGLNDDLENLAKSADDTSNKILGVGKASKEAGADLDKTTKSTAEAAKATKEHAAQMKALRDALADPAKPKKEKDPDADFKALQKNLEKQQFLQDNLTDSNKNYINILADITTGTLTLTAAQQEYALTTAQAIDAADDLKKTQLEGQKVTDDVATDVEKANKEYDRLYALLEKGAITEETFQRAYEKNVLKPLEQTPEIVGDANDSLKGMQDLLQQIADGVDGYSKDIAGSLVDIATSSDSAGDAIGQFAKKFVESLAQMAIQILIIKPLLDSVSAYFGFGKTGGTSIASKSAMGNVFDQGRLMAFASGGVISAPMLFPMANGGVGLAGEAGPEAIMPLSRGPDGALGVKSSNDGGANVQVNVYNQTDSKVDVQQDKAGPNGETVINVMVQKAVSQAITAGKFDSTFAAVYGLNRKGH